MEPSLSPEEMKTKRAAIQKAQIQSNLLRSGVKFIDKFLELLEEPEEELQPATIKKYMQKMLHVIFFFGQIQKVPIGPEEFFPGPEYEREFRLLFPAPFEQCTTHLPTQTPYSILLDYVTEVKGLTTPEVITSFLETFNAQLWEGSEPSKFTFNASVIAYCFYHDPENDATTNHFCGASLSCRGQKERLIMIGLSCLKTWHKAVAYVVYHEKAITFPDGVWSQAFQSNMNERRYEEKSPCLKCQELFQNVTFRPLPEDPQKPAPWNYGNCAEVESFSKLLQETGAVEEGLWVETARRRMRVGDITEEERQNIEAEITEELRRNLASRQFYVDSIQVFEPQ